MEPLIDAQAEARLHAFLHDIGVILHYKKRRESFAAYAMGLLSPIERKSAEPIAALIRPDKASVDAVHQRLLHFVGVSQWADEPVRTFAARYALDAMTERGPVVSWIVDDTGFLKQGKHSVGVQRQYTGSAGKIANCQIGVSLTVATATMPLPVDFELYLPRTWTDDPERRKEARIPDSVHFSTKPQLALAMIDRAIANQLPRGVVLADTAYGNASDFRVGLRRRGLDYGVDIEGRTKIRPMRADGRPGKPVQAHKLAEGLGIRQFERMSWREGSGQTLWSWFAARRVLVERDTRALGRAEVVWLLIEWLRDEPQPTKFTLLTLGEDTSLRDLVRTARHRWPTERVYEDMKGTIGLDHFEGRRFNGWHHHVTVALCCYAFAAAEHARSFPPSARGSRQGRAHRRAPRAALRRFSDQRHARHWTRRRSLAATLPTLLSAITPRRWPHPHVVTQ